MPLPTNTSNGADVALLDTAHPSSGAMKATTYPSVAEVAGDIRYVDFVPLSERRGGVDGAPGAYPVAYLGFSETASVPAYSLMLARTPQEALVAASVLEWYAFLNSGSRDAQNDASYALDNLIQLLAHADGVSDEQLAAVIESNEAIINRIERLR